MKTRYSVWIALAFAGVIVACLALPPMPKPKARATRIQGVNTIRQVSLQLTNAPHSISNLALPWQEKSDQKETTP